MLGEVLTKILVVLFGYAYPAFECFKMVEQRPGEIQQLRFWCQYWIIVAIVTVIEKLADTVVSWVPMYGEVKLAFFVYLWYPKTKGSDLVYETFLRPLVMQYEPDIEQRLRHLRAKSGQLIMFYIKNFSDKGTTLFLEALNYVVSQGSRVSRSESFFSRSKRSASSPVATKHSSTAYDTLGSTADDVAAADPHAGRPKQRRPPYKY
ncbi:HVA22-like protein i [Ananas comosus]|uniref:HVA22-like protein n=1 Tax=Ananas comosus TaxID=4615 RepID=A0A199VHA0_ANACO|nr:HVA22-like protein i [Ananas comosus]